MRPVNRGFVPKNEDGTDKIYINYRQAKDDLIERLGSFCSYCEMGVKNQPDIEHVIPKSVNPDLERKWDNFLLACKPCNIIKDNNNKSREGYVFPDTQNTAFLYEYSISGVKVRDDLDAETKKLANATFNLVELNRPTDTTNREDDRARARHTSWGEAQDALADYLILLPSTPNREILVKRIAKSCQGFFTQWLQVFKEHPKVKRAILENVAGSAMECYDKKINPLKKLSRK